MFNFIAMFSGGLVTMLVFGFIYMKGKEAVQYTVRFVLADTGEDDRPKMEMFRFTLKMWRFMFILSFFSFHILWFATSLLWILTAIIYYYFAKLWKANGYSVFRLTGLTVIVLSASFIISAFIRQWLQSVFFR